MIKKIIIAAVIIFVIAGIITAAAVYMKKHKNDHVLDGPGMEREPHDYLTGCTYYNGGGMDGGSESIELRKQADGTVIYNYWYCPYIGAQEEHVEKVYGGEVFNKISEICKKTGVLTWGKLPKSELELLDAPVTTISFTAFGDAANGHYSVSSNDVLPESGNGLFTDIYNYLISLK